MKRTSGKRWISLVLALCLCLLVGCGGKQAGYDPLKGVETRMITDSAGRQVEIPAEITRIAPSGSTAQMILMPVAYDLLVGLSSSPSTAQMSYFPEEMRYLPTFGQFYGSKASLNMESLIAAQPQLIIDLGDAKDSIAEDMDTIQKQTGIPTIFIEADLDTGRWGTFWGGRSRRRNWRSSLTALSPWPRPTPQKSRSLSGSRCSSAPDPRALPATQPDPYRRMSSTLWGR